MTKRSCGSCTLCCKVMGVPDLEPKKLPHQWCQHCDIGKGCRIYETRPTTCREFECVWLQDTQNLFGENCRPDKLGVVFVPAGDGIGLIAHCDPARPTAWRNPQALARLRVCAAAGYLAAARAGKRYWVITPTHEWEVPADCVVTDKDSNQVDVRVPREIASRIGFVRHRQV